MTIMMTILPFQLGLKPVELDTPTLKRNNILDNDNILIRILFTCKVIVILLRSLCVRHDGLTLGDQQVRGPLHMTAT
jgi:hypothetical protein